MSASQKSDRPHRAKLTVHLVDHSVLVDVAADDGVHGVNDAVTCVEDQGRAGEGQEARKVREEEINVTYIHKFIRQACRPTSVPRGE